jgi:ABC-2 type transport system ATP-binding protein
VTIFLTTHYIDEAEHADRVALMLGGKVIALATPRELRETGLTGVLLEVESDPPIDALDYLPTVPGVHEVTLYGTLLHVLVDTSITTEGLKAVMQDHGLHVAGIRTIKPSLEDVFVSRIRGTTRG